MIAKFLSFIGRGMWNWIQLAGFRARFFKGGGGREDFECKY